jgi:hypothetical protein
MREAALRGLMAACEELRLPSVYTHDEAVIRSAAGAIVGEMTSVRDRAQLAMLDEPPLSPTLEREAADGVMRTLGVDAEEWERDAVLKALLAARERGRDENAALLRRAVGLLSDMDRLRGGIASVLDEYAGIAPKLGHVPLDDTSREAMRAAALDVLREALAAAKPLSASRHHVGACFFMVTPQGARCGAPCVLGARVGHTHEACRCTMHNI